MRWSCGTRNILWDITATGTGLKWPLQILQKVFDEVSMTGKDPQLWKGGQKRETFGIPKSKKLVMFEWQSSQFVTIGAGMGPFCLEPTLRIVCRVGSAHKRAKRHMAFCFIPCRIDTIWGEGCLHLIIPMSACHYSELRSAMTFTHEFNSHKSPIGRSDIIEGNWLSMAKYCILNNYTILSN